jgi:hypothetical protein
MSESDPRCPRASRGSTRELAEHALAKVLADEPAFVDLLAITDCAHDVADRPASGGGDAPVIEERGMFGAVGHLMEAVHGEGRELVLQCEPARLLPQICRQDEERFSTERRQSLGLIEDRRQRGERIAIGPQFSR